jgi:hypothetical protein
MSCPRVYLLALIRPLPAASGIVLALLAWRIAYAISGGTISVERVAGAGWLAQGVAIDMDLSVEMPTARVRIERMQFGASPDTRSLRGITIDCTQLALEGSIIACDQARIHGTFPGIGRQALRGAVRFDRDTKALALTLANIKVGGGIAQMKLAWGRSAWSGQLHVQRGKLEVLRALVQEWLPAGTLPSVVGNVDLELDARGQGTQVLHADWRAQVRQLKANNSAGTLAGEQLTLVSQGSLTRLLGKRAAQGWRFKAAFGATHGQAYAEPVFVDLGKHPLAITTEGRWLAARRSAVIEKFTVEQEKALSAAGQAVVELGEKFAVPSLRVDIRRAELPGAYSMYLQPFMLDGAFGSVDALGSISGSVEVAANRPTRLAISVSEVSADDTRDRWSVAGLNGSVRWHSDRLMPPTASSLHWQGARLLGLDIGAAGIQFATVDRDFIVHGATQIPVLDGSIQIAQLQVKDAGRPDMTLSMDATLQPISMQRLCTVFGWPTFGGQVSGRLANLQLSGGVLSMGTALDAQVFNGRVHIANLRLEEPFGKWPRFAADIDIDGLDLEQMTAAFEFGRITGRLSGSIKELRLFNWMPVAFDAFLYTPPNDRSEHRISQRAVQNIGSLGGSASGVSAALSRSVLRFFENFRYERLGIRCRLENQICAMNGVEPAPGGYYLVKGRGLPRIDIIANTTRVDWPRLVWQLQAATQSRGAEASR